VAKVTSIYSTWEWEYQCNRASGVDPDKPGLFPGKSNDSLWQRSITPQTVDLGPIVETGEQISTECRWFQGSGGDFCDANGKLITINQSKNTLNGVLPDKIGLLSSLTIINLSVNEISGTIPAAIFGYLTSLDLITNFSQGRCLWNLVP
jgi:hypothetical protein